MLATHHRPTNGCCASTVAYPESFLARETGGETGTTSAFDASMAGLPRARMGELRYTPSAKEKNIAAREKKRFRSLDEMAALRKREAYDLARYLCGRTRKEKFPDSYVFEWEWRYDVADAMKRCQCVYPHVEDETVAWKLENDLGPCFVVEEAPGRGKCLRAAKDIPAGTIFPFLGDTTSPEDSYRDGKFYNMTVHLDGKEVMIQCSPDAEKVVAFKDAFIGGRMNEPPMDPINLFRNVAIDLANGSEVTPGTIADVLEALEGGSFRALPLAFSKVNEKDKKGLEGVDSVEALNEKIEWFFGKVCGDDESKKNELLERLQDYKKNDWVWDGNQGRVVGLEDVWNASKSLKEMREKQRLTTSVAEHVPVDKYYPRGAYVVRVVDANEGLYAVGHIRLVTIDPTVALENGAAIEGVDYQDEMVRYPGKATDVFLYWKNTYEDPRDRDGLAWWPWTSASKR